MMNFEKFNTINCRTQSIELAVKELSERKSVTMTDVREFMDTLVSNKIKTGRKLKTKLPNDEEVEYDEMKRICDLYSYKSDENEIYMRSNQSIIENQKFFHELKEDVKVSDALKWLALNASFTEKKSIEPLVEWFGQMVTDVKETCRNGDVTRSRQNKMHLQINSSTKGSGKSTFIENLINKAKEAGIEAKSEVELPMGGFYNGMNECRNLLVGYKERVYQKIDEATMMHIGRRESYSYTEKGKMAIDIPSRAITIGSTNGNPYIKDDRTQVVIDCISADFETRQQILTNFTNFLQNLRGDVSLYNTRIYDVNEAKFCNFVSFLKSVRKENNNNNMNNDLNYKTKLQNFKIPGMDALQSYLEDFTSDLELLDWVSVKGFYKLWKRQTGKDLSENARFLSFEKPIAECFNFLCSHKLCKFRGPANDMQRQINLFDLLEDIRNYNFSTKEETIEDVILDAAAEWERIIKLAEDFENDPNDQEESETESEETIETTSYNKEENTMTLGEIEKTKNENKVMVHLVRKQGKGPKFTHYMQLDIEDRVSGENLLNKRYFIFDDNGNVSNESQCLQLASDMKQIWYSKGRIEDVENITDEEYKRFSGRLMRVISGSEELHITANVITKDNEIYAFKI